MFTRTASLLLSILVVAGTGCTSDLDVGPVGESSPLSSGGDSSVGGDEGDDAGAEDDATAFTPKTDEPPETLLACDLDFACEHPLELVRGDANAYADSDVCAFKALAAGQIALVQTVSIFADAEAYLDHVVDATGGVLRQAHGQSDHVGLWRKPVERCTLQSAAFFMHCAAQFDATCLEPERWIVPDSCRPLGSLTCPAP